MKKMNSIFIIDDDPITVFGIKKMLKDTVDCEAISTFHNGKMAIEYLKEGIPNNLPIPEVIFLDINMPIMDGWEFLEEFLKLPIQKRIIINVITSSIDPSDYEKWNHFRLNSYHYLNFKNKPIFKIETTDLTRIHLAS
ncbi:response regulator [Flagellimonas sp.]|uniref:response regulator n=1 Tax=Flagellimonas sp. TaxID=2058762 RepID=UPI003F49D9C4